MGDGRTKTFYKVAHVSPKTLKILAQKQKKLEGVNALESPRDGPKPSGGENHVVKRTDALWLKMRLEKGEDCLTGLYVQSVMGQPAKDFESPSIMLHLLNETRPTQLTLVSRKVDVDFAQNPLDPKMTREQRAKHALRSHELFARKSKVNFVEVTEDGSNADAVVASLTEAQAAALESRKRQAYRKDLEGEHLLPLEKRAKRLGVPPDTLEQLMEESNPKQAFIDTIMEFPMPWAASPQSSATGSAKKSKQRKQKKGKTDPDSSYYSTLMNDSQVHVWMR